MGSVFFELSRKTEASTPVGGALTSRVYTYKSAANKIANVKIGAVTERLFVHDAGGNPARGLPSGRIATDTRTGFAPSGRLAERESEGASEMAWSLATRTTTPTG